MSMPAALATFDLALPYALLALIVVPFIAGAAWLAMHRRQRARAMLGSALFARGGDVPRAIRRAGVVLLVLAVVLASFAAARPRWGLTDAEVAQQGIDIVIALDVSRSMLADDIAPSRAGASVRALGEMLVHLTGNRVGLVIFAGTAFERSPLTLDTRAVGSLIARAQGESALVRPGSDFATALETALNSLTVDEPARSQVVVLVSDGEEIDGRPRALEAALARARDKGVQVVTVFAATERPTALPLESGAADVTQGDRAVLARIARETGGQLRELATLPGAAVEFRRMAQTTFESATEHQRIDRFQWFLAAALVLLVAESLLPSVGRRRPLRLRPGALGAAAAVLLLVACSGTALYRHVEAGNRAYDLGDYETALAAYQQAAEQEDGHPVVDYNLGNALHQLLRFEEATVASAAALEASDDPLLIGRATYALGNHAFQRSEYEEARDRYIATLRIDPGDRDAKANLELALLALEPPPPPEEQPAPGEEPDPNGEPPEGEPGDGQTEPGGEPGDPAQPGESDGEGEGEPGEPSPSELLSLDEVLRQLEQALGELGPEVTQEQALAILELARRANELRPLPTRGGLGVPAR